MAVAALRDKEALRVEGDDAPRTPRQVIVSGILINLLNPKLTIFFVAFLPQFGGTSIPAMLELSAVFMAVTFVVFALYGVAAARVRRHVVERPRVMAWLRRTFAASFVALGARLALQSR